MSLVPSRWNVVVVGHWNRAILTPSGISRRLFGLEEGTPVEVLVPIDAIGPYQVKHDSVIVIARSDRLIVEVSDATFEQLGIAKSIASKAVSELPETPFSAAGINIGYRVDGLEGALQEITSHNSDSRLSDGDFKIVGRLHQRTLEYGEGVINVKVERTNDEPYSIEFNFHRKSSEKSELKAWLDKPIAMFQSQSRALLNDYLGLELEEDRQGE